MGKLEAVVQGRNYVICLISDIFRVMSGWGWVVLLSTIIEPLICQMTKTLRFRDVGVGERATI